MSDDQFYVVAETNAESTGIEIVNLYPDSEAADAAAENKRDPDLHGQRVVSRPVTVEDGAVSPHPGCENETCEGNHTDDTQHCDWHGNELTLCESCIEYHGSAIEVLDGGD